jgi:sugar phosphate isomerase/epimerase
MKKIMSINHKFFNVSPEELILMSKNKIDGFEIYVRSNQEFDYLNKLAKLCKKENIYLQVHGNIEENKILEYLDEMNKISSILGYTINIVFHSKMSINVSKSIEKTMETFEKIFSYINEKNLNILISIENLNSVAKIKRLNKQEIIPILNHFKNLYFTYDIGHELIEKGNIVDLDNICKERIINTHIHSYRGKLDHQFIKENDKHINELNIAFNFLKKIKYDGCYVFEYDLYKAKGNSDKEKIEYFIKMIGEIKC